MKKSVINQPTILIVDDEPEVLLFVCELLSKENYNILTAETAEEAIAITEKKKPDLMISDINLPGMSGMELCKVIKKKYSDILIMFLSGINDEFDKVLGLELGAEDYITKPFGAREFKARIKVVLRRLQDVSRVKENPNSLEFYDMNIDLSCRTVKIKQELIDLTKKEFDILVLLASRPGQVFTRDIILERIWKDDSHISDRTVDVHIGRLRDKIEMNFNQPHYIETVRGVGYRFRSIEVEH